MAGTSIMIPYERRREPSAFSRLAWIAALLGLATFYGLMIAVLPPQLLVIPFVPIAVMFALILWMLPDTDHVHDRQMDGLMCFYIGSNVLWPSYIALNLPGLPWVTPTRIAVFMLLSLVLFNLATSALLRGRITDSINGVPLLRKLFWGFWAMTTLALFLSAEPFTSINKYANNQIFWTMMFVVTAFLSTREGFVMRMSRIFAWSTVVIALLGIYEFKIERVFWLDHLPGWLQVDPEYLDRIMQSQARAGTDIYRTKATFATSLSFAEYLAMMFPLQLHFMMRAKNWWKFGLMLVAVFASVVAMYLTNARSAMVGLLIAIAVYPFFVAWRARKREAQGLGANATLFAYPAMMAVLAGLVVFWPRLHVMVLGGGAQQASSEARKVQWSMGWHKFLHNPIGHGTAMAGHTLQYYNGAGVLTIDTYYLSLLLEYGIIGLVVFVLMFGLPSWYAFKSYVASDTEEGSLVAPIAVGLFNFVVIKSVLSSEINIPIAFVMLGMVVGLIWQQRRASGTAARLITL